MTTRIVTVIQARVGSRRLPGKVLLPLGQVSVLEAMLERVVRSRLAGAIVVATTTLDDDLPIVEAARRAGVRSFRGHPTDLLDRHTAVARWLDADAIVKIPSDCPLIDPAVIDAVLEAYLTSRVPLDYVSNLHPPTHPDGMDVEIVRREALETAWREAVAPHEREHTTPFIWDRPDRFRLLNVAWDSGLDLSASHRVVLDYLEDYLVIRAVYDRLSPGNPFFTLDQVVEFLDDHPEVANRNERYRNTHWYDQVRDQLQTLAQRGPS